MGEAVEELNLAAHRLQRFVEGETARTIYKLPPGGRFDPMRRDVAALLSAITRAEAQKEGSTASQGAARVEELEKALEEIADLCPTTQEVCLASTMGQIAIVALSSQGAEDGK